MGEVGRGRFNSYIETFEEAMLPPRIKMVLLHQCEMTSEYLFDQIKQQFKSVAVVPMSSKYVMPFAIGQQNCN